MEVLALFCNIWYGDYGTALRWRLSFRGGTKTLLSKGGAVFSALGLERRSIAMSSYEVLTIMLLILAIIVPLIVELTRKK